jgi:hypothetical protein
MDLALNSTGDIYLDGQADLSVVTGGEAISQHIQQRLKFFRGEWFLDRGRGMPYFRDILGKKNPNSYRMSAIFRDAILGTPGVLELREFDLTVDARTRVLSLSFRAVTEDGDIDYSGEV